MNENSRGFAPILIVVILGIIGIVGYLVLRPKTTPPPPSLSPTPFPDYSEVTANWKIYINSQYGYSVKYPEGSFPTEHPDENIYLNFVSFGDRLKENSLWFEITVREADLNEEVDYIEWQASHSLVELTNEEDLTIEGYPTKRLDYEPSKYDEPKSTSFIVINRNQHSYTLSSRPENINQILSTFKFSDYANETDGKADLSEIRRFNDNKLSYIPKMTLPNGLEESQLEKAQKIEGIYFVNFLKGNINIPVNSKVQRSGVLFVKEGNHGWKIFYEIVELMNYRNNPYNFWKEKDTYYTVIVDNSGAGSGEGLGKLVSINSPSKEWKILDCFYYVPESYIQYFNSLSENIPLSEGVKKYIDPPFQRYNGDYVLDKTLNKFVINERIEEDCTAFKLFL